jgi:lipopolysaccharide transport system ATP-binding protein
LGSGLDHDVDGVQNIINLCLIKGMSLAEARGLLDNISEFTGLGDFLYLPVRTYSSGMLLRLMFAVATIKAPDIFLLDEMFSTGDAEFQEKSMKRINEIIDKSKIFVFASHDHGLLKRYCNRIFRLEHGKVVEISVLDLG